MSETSSTSHLPFIEATLLLPVEGADGSVAICTNTISPGEVHAQVDPRNRKLVPVMGSLATSINGAETLIYNALLDPTVTSTVLFGPETSSFYPSTNLLQAYKNGFNPEHEGNRIFQSVGVSAQYPSVGTDILAAFTDAITLYPLYSSTDKESQRVVHDYLEWMEGNKRIGGRLLDILKKANSGTDSTKRKDYDVLNSLLLELRDTSVGSKSVPRVDPKKLERLQPPIVELAPLPETENPVPFYVSADNDRIKVVISSRDGTQQYVVAHEDDFTF